MIVTANRQKGTNGNMCGAVLPSGQTVGAIVRQQRAELLAAQQQQLQAQEQSPDGGGAGYTTGYFAGIVRPNGPVDFKNNFRGQASGAFLGQAGNFAYWSIGSGILPNTELDIGAGAYGLYSAARGRPFSDLHPPFFMDSSAANTRSAGLASAGCPVPGH